jgi:hypothetical protein
MTFNSTSKLYEYNKTFASAGNFYFNILCNGSTLGYDALNATDDFTITARVVEFYWVNDDNSIALGEISPSVYDTKADSLNTTNDDTWPVNNNNSNVNIVLYIDRTDFTASTDVRGSSTQAVTLTNLDYVTTLTPAPTAATWWNGSDYITWTQNNANDEELWIYFDDNFTEGTANKANQFNSTAGGSEETPDSANNFGPYLIRANGSEMVTLTDYPEQTWSDGSSPDSGDKYFEVVIPYYNESYEGNPGGNAGALLSKYIQIAMKSEGTEIMVREGGTTSAGTNWNATELTPGNWDIAKIPDGTLNATYYAKDVTVTLLGNRYTVHTIDTSPGTENVILSFAILMPLTDGGITHADFFAAVAWPADAPSADYTWNCYINAVDWGPEDGIANTADDVQYP